MARQRRQSEGDERGRMTVQFSVPFEEEPEEPLDLAAYVTDRNTGEVVVSTPIKDGRFELELDPARAPNLSISIAPQRPEGADALPTSGQLGRLRAYEPVFSFDPKVRRYDLRAIPVDVSQFWWWCLCRVRGKVVKPVTSGGVTVDMPVCHVRVHICEVDPIWIILEKLPDPEIFRLRDDLLEAIRRPFPPTPPEPPWPPIGPGPGPIGPLDLPEMDVTDLEVEGAPLPASFQIEAEPESVASRAEILERPSAHGLSAQLPIEAQAALSSPSAQSVRRALLDNAVLIYPWICWWRWLWPWLWRCDE